MTMWFMRRGNSVSRSAGFPDQSHPFKFPTTNHPFRKQEWSSKTPGDHLPDFAGWHSDLCAGLLTGARRERSFREKHLEIRVDPGSTAANREVQINHPITSRQINTFGCPTKAQPEIETSPTQTTLGFVRITGAEARSAVKTHSYILR
ncbi:hypothetical protein BC938DRAFT_477552 [Jimgerdemannia flammicorona]|uniref:Uncharacterized protein n=1 Tax=Jimgerdemannia flammicorona TaxID=994334 RepID=A0A433QP83_9FUNG|nr:hypothetical protein BC938DRAFT_477552 [Jimgerdemannia flammicorona]